MQLKEQTFQNVTESTPLHKLKVVFTGEPSECEAFAKEKGFIWKDSPRMLFGGYYYKSPTETESPNVLLPT